MSQNFLPVDREQVLLMPPSLAEWLPRDHFAWFVLEAVEEMDLGPFYVAYRADGHGRAAHDPKMMVALLLYAYARGERSSRRIERACVEDVAYRVIAANRKPDHATIARFRQRHETALAGLFVDVLRISSQAGLAKVGMIAIDGSKLSANASQESSYDYERVAREILAEAARIDEAEDELYGEARGDELPEHLRTAEGRRRALREAKRKLREREQLAESDDDDPVVELELDRSWIVAGQHGRSGWLREGRRQLERRREQEAKPVPQSRAARLLEAERRMRENLAAARRANEAYEEFRATGRMKNGRRFGAPPKPYVPPELPEGKINISDLDSGSMKTLRGHMQGYNAQMVTNAQQIVIAAEITNVAPDFGTLEPMVDAALRELDAAGIEEKPELVLADAGYWHQRQMENVISDGMQVLIPPDAANRKGARPGWEGGFYDHMRRVLATDYGGRLYKRRQSMIEPVFAHMKFNRGILRFMRRGRPAVRSEWRLITATNNLLKLRKHRIAAQAA